MKVNIDISRSLDTDLPLEKAKLLLKNAETTMSRFPKLRSFKKLAANKYLLEMTPIGSRVANIVHEVSFGAHYKLDAKSNELKWTALPEQGNAQLDGALKLESHGKGTRLTLSVKGEFHDVPVPMIYRFVAPTYLKAKFAILADAFLERTRTALAE